MLWEWGSNWKCSGVIILTQNRKSIRHCIVWNYSYLILGRKHCDIDVVGHRHSLFLLTQWINVNISAIYTDSEIRRNDSKCTLPLSDRIGFNRNGLNYRIYFISDSYLIFPIRSEIIRCKSDPWSSFSLLRKNKQ